MSTTSANAFVAVSPGVYRLEAALTFASVPLLRDGGLELINSASDGLTLDLAAVSTVDSAGLALLIDWLAEARRRSRALKYAEAPSTLLSLARLSDVEKLITG